MYLHIAPNRPVSDIQEEFSNEFTFLKLEFFNKRVLSTSDYSDSQRVAGTRKIGDIQSVVTDGKIEIDGEMKVNELEKKLKDEFGLASQVFRKSGKLWLETTMTDGWSLNQQNKHGRELSARINFDTKEGDFDLNRDADH